MGDELMDEMPHRTCVAGQPALKKRRFGHGSASNDEVVKRTAAVSFANEEQLVTTVLVAEYKSGDVKEHLWATNPLKSVLCEKCEMRVPQSQGRLHGKPDASQFMQEKFY